MSSKKILFPLPNYGFDPTETAIPWQILSEAKHTVIFAIPEGHITAADERMVTGKGLGIWKALLQARKDAVDAYRDMESNSSFCHPLSYSELRENDFDGILLPGGHDKGVKPYLESKLLQNLIVDFFRSRKPVGAICHGTVLAARSIDLNTGKSVIQNYHTTSLLKSQELAAYRLTRLWLKDYYLTYPGLTVEDEVTAALADKSQFIHGPRPILRDDPDHLQRGFAIRDRNYLSARWPGDAYRFSHEFIQLCDALEGGSH